MAGQYGDYWCGMCPYCERQEAGNEGGNGSSERGQLGAFRTTVHAINKMRSVKHQGKWHCEVNLNPSGSREDVCLVGGFASLCAWLTVITVSPPHRGFLPVAVELKWMGAGLQHGACNCGEYVMTLV